MNLGVYIHIPFCKQKCLYCDFPSYANVEHLYQDYIAALCRDIAGQGGVLSSNRVDTIYIGGGTPSILPTEMLIEVMSTLQRHFTITADAEISMEANPGSVDEEKLAALKQSGINRISFGVQTFSDSLLKGIGRIHSSAEAMEAVHLAKKVGLSQINLDLMYGLPGQTKQCFETSVQQAVSLNCTHISVYGLKVEEGTPFAQRQMEGLLSLPEENEELDMYEWVTHFLPEHGLRRYEISNYARLGDECRHNVKYWNYKPYLGLGAAAHSFLSGQRLGNVTRVQEYIKRMAAGQSPIESHEILEPQTARAEFAFLALRTARGLNSDEFENYFGCNFWSCYGNVVDVLLKKQLIIANKEGICLTELGMRFGNAVFRAFLPD